MRTDLLQQARGLAKNMLGLVEVERVAAANETRRMPRDERL